MIKSLLICDLHMSLVTRKPVFWVPDQIIDKHPVFWVPDQITDKHICSASEMSLSLETFVYQQKK